jgi:hypothetical protein
MSVSPRRVAALALLLFVFLWGCSTTYKIDQIDYKTDQTPAAILLGDPQVFDRASLINDRRREIDYLQQLLLSSVTATFPPQIVQELRTVEALSTNLGLSFGKSVPGNPTASDLTQQISVAKLQAQLAVLQKQIEGIQAAQPPTVPIPAPDLTTTAGASASSVTVPDVAALRAAVKELQTQLTTLAATQIAAVAPPGKDFAAFVDPRNELLARQAYRRDIRAAMAEAQLDDAHDLGGDALYRLQFQATVLPPDNDIKRWAAARLSIERPQLTKDGVTTFYFGWLDYISRVLSTPLRDRESNPASPGHDFEQDRYFSSIQWFQFFDLIDVFAKDSRRDPLYACLDHRTASERQLQDLRCDEGAGEDERQSWGYSDPCNDGYRFLGTYAIPRGLMTVPSYPIAGRPRLAEVSSKNAELLERFTRPTTVPEHFEDYLPDAFCRAIVDDNGELCKSLAKQGLKAPARAGLQHAPMSAVRSYSVLPVELSQRIGLTSQSSRSMQTALSVAAQISRSAKGSLDSGALTQADIRTQAVEREPLVVGFAGTEQRENSSPQSVFGWLFGPEFIAPKQTTLSNRPGFLSWLRRDITTLTLSQQVHNYGVTADVTFPGWWSYVDISVETAFVKDWSDGSVLETSSSSCCSKPTASARYTKTVSLPFTDASLDALTSFISAGHLGPEAGGPAPGVSIRYVTRDVVPSCASTVVFQIGGSNIWRAERVYFGGVPAISVDVLPDMKSIAAKFDMNLVFGTLSNTENTVESVPLVVASKQGESPALPILVIGKRQPTSGGTACQSPILLPTTAKSLPPTVVDVTPHEVCSGTTLVPLVVHGINLPADLVAIPTFAEASPKKDRTTARATPTIGCCSSAAHRGHNASSHRQITLTAKKPLNKGSVVVALANASSDFAHSTTITVTDCSSSGSNTPKAGKPAAGSKPE